MERLGRLFSREDAHRAREARIDRADHRAGRHGALDRERGDLAERVDAGVRASGSRHSHVALVERAQRILQKPLDRHAIGLKLPSDVVGAVVGEGDLEARHHRATLRLSSNSFRMSLYSSAQLVASSNPWFSTGNIATDQFSLRSSMRRWTSRTVS